MAFILAGCGASPHLTTSGTDQERLISHAAQWSESTHFKRIGGWSFDRPLDLPPVVSVALAAKNTPRTPATELQATIRLLYQPVEPDAVNESIWCQSFTLIRFIRVQAQTQGITLPPAPDCPAFNAWARLEHLRAFEILFASPSAYDPIASFGHTSFRLRYDDPNRSTFDDTVYEVIALTGFGDSVLKYIFRGLTGGYPLVFEPTQLRQVSRDNREAQERDLRRYTVNLHPTQRRLVMQRIWEAERRAYLPYQFFSNNCSSYLAWLLETALFDQATIPEQTTGLAAPSSTLDALAAVTVPATGRPLLSINAEVLYSSQNQADYWRRLQRQAWQSVEDAINHQAGIPPALKARWRTLELDDPASFPPQAQAILARMPELADSLRLISLGTLKGSRAQLDARIAQIKQIDFARLQTSAQYQLPTLGVLLAQRRALYSDEDLTRRGRLRDERHAWAKGILESSPRRPATADERRIQHAHTQALARFRSAANAHNALQVMLALDTSSPRLTGPSWVQHIKRKRQHDVERIWQGGETQTGRSYHRVGVTQRGHSKGLVYDVALWHESLGQQRFHGIGPTRELHLVRSEHHVEIQSAGPTWRSTHVTPFSISNFDRQIARSISAWSMVERIGWKAESALWFGPGRRHLWLQAGPGLLVKDGRTSRWQIGATTLLRPGLRLGASDYVDLSMNMTGFGRYRLRAIGSISLQVSVEQALSAGLSWARGQAAHWSVKLDLPFRTGERLRLNLQLGQQCTGQWHCPWTTQTGLAW
jgi:hypothetical protein